MKILNSLQTSNDYYITPSGELSNSPMTPKNKLLSRANRLRGDIRSAITLVQVCTGLDRESQIEIQLYTMVAWFRWYYKVDEGTDMYYDIEHMVYDCEMLQLWMAEWNKRELNIMEEFSRWYQSRFKIIRRSKYLEPHEKRKLLSIEAAERWEGMHRSLVFDHTSQSFMQLVNGLNRILP